MPFPMPSTLRRLAAALGGGVKMEKNKKRAVRRHHLFRVRESKRWIARRWALRTNFWINKWTWKTIDGELAMVHYLDPKGQAEYNKYIERTIRRLANHNKCPCQMCKLPRYNRRYAKLGKNQKAFSY